MRIRVVDGNGNTASYAQIPVKLTLEGEAQLKEKKKELEISLWMDTVDKSKELIRAQQRRLEIFTDDYNNVNSRLEETEKYIEERCLRLKLLPKRQRKCSRDWKRNISRMQKRQ